ncbi:hypothetical protein [Symbioplanes lichenis]|uniref:hypothetical protein n=1 Tax=Symbioplanes lichenis TaxID=1629072 RepID=UPI0027389E69|nr:hypothetical protein [Actinoplanes lichenis]
MSLARSRAVTVATAVVALVLPASAAHAAEANRPPAVPASLTVGGLACAPGGVFVGTTTPRVTGVFGDEDLGVVAGERLTPEFVVRPAGVTWSEQAIAFPGTVFTTVPAALTDGVTYQLQARATDAAGAVSDWSPVCTFTVDTTRPHAPAVSSADYPAGTPSGGAGVPGTFTFAAAGDDRDVVSFRWSLNDGVPNQAPADADGRATVEITPGFYGTQTVSVQAVDRTGNRSAETRYSFTVVDRTPRVWDQNPEAGLGEARTVRLSSAVPGTASFTYRLNDGPAVTVAAEADGSSTVSVSPDRRGANYLTVTSRTASGVVSPEYRATLYVPVTVPQPVVSSPDFPEDGSPAPTAGDEVTVVLRTDSPEVTEFVYTLDFGATEQTIPADANGNATFRHTTNPEATWFEVDARARTADGFESDLVYAGWELTPAVPSAGS